MLKSNCSRNAISFFFGDSNVALGIIGKKIGMTQMFSPEGEVIPVTVVQAGPCTVVQKKTAEKDGYSALQLGFGEKKAKRCSRALQGHLKKAGDAVCAVLREFRVENDVAYDVGQAVSVDIFEPGETVEITGTSKGKGFAGSIKRHGFNRGPMAHGSKHHRAPGSTGHSAWPAKVFKGKRMPGQLGNERVTVRGLQIVDSRPDENLLLIRGAVPGHKNSLIMICKAKEQA
jgi:large subunit ribosomal protein L3